MMINALNSGARVFMADFEDALSPPWTNVVGGQVNCMDAVRRTLDVHQPRGKALPAGRAARHAGGPAARVAPGRKHVLVDGRPVPASLFDFALYFYHNARELLDRGSGPYFYLPKLESHLEARLWNEVFARRSGRGPAPGTIRATVLIETILAAFEMDEILYELRAHAAGLNAGRWDYLFSVIKKFRQRPEFVLPDRAQVTMARALHAGVHRAAGADLSPPRRPRDRRDGRLHPVRRDEEVNRDGAGPGAGGQGPRGRPRLRRRVGGASGSGAASWRRSSARVLGDRPNQKDRQPGRCPGRPRRELLDVRVPGGRVTEAGVHGNVSVALQYLEAWLRGSGAVAINNLMEDTATAEIARAQLWQWIHHGTADEAGRPVTLARVRAVLEEELAARATSGRAGGATRRSSSTAWSRPRRFRSS